MTTVKETQRGKAGANNVLPGDLRPLYPVPMASRSGMSPLLCVGQDLSVDCGSHAVSVSGIFVTPAGSVLFVLEEPYSAVIVHRFISEVSSWASDDLDSICSDLTLRESGQAYRIIDLMAARGYLFFSDGQDFSERISANLHCADFSVFCIDGKRGAAD